MSPLRDAVYDAAMHALVPAALMHLWWRGRRQPAYRQHIGERFGHYPAGLDAPRIWVHAVSVGETRAAQPLIQALRTRAPDQRILMTHTTPTGRETGEQLFGDRVDRLYAPYDLPSAVTRFIDHVRPSVGILMETELWPNLVRAVARSGAPVYLVNARMSDRSARGYARFESLTRDTLAALSGVAAQTQADADRLLALGARDVVVTGNLKYDVSPDHATHVRGMVFRERFGASRPVVLAASTREGEEALVLDAFARLSAPGVLLVIVPRHPQRFDDVEAMVRARGLECLRRSAGIPVPQDVSVVLGDSMGELFSYYAAADVAFVGGSLLPLGGQNLIEACAVGTPVLVGPHTFNFTEATEMACEAGAALRVPDAAGLAREWDRLLHAPDARKAMAQAATRFASTHRGATERVLRMIGPALARVRSG